jgi:chaperonin GroEL
MERAVEVAVEALRKQARALGNRDDVARIATVGAKNDEAFGALIAEAFERVGRQGVITVEEGRGMETTLEVVEGVRFDRGYLSPYFVTSPDTMEVVLDNALVLLTDLKFGAARDLVPVLEHAARAGRPVLLVADDVEAEALATLVVNRLRGTVSSVAVRAPETGDRRRSLLEDIGTLVGARLYAGELGHTLERFDPADFGRAKKVIVDKESTTVVSGGGRPEAIRDRIKTVERELNESESDYDKDLLRKRLARLAGGVAVVRVGAPTEIAMTERRARLEDALSATRAAVEEGVVTGGGVALLRAQAAVRALELKADEAVGRDIVASAMEEPARQIAANAGEEGPVAVEKIRAGQGSFGYNALKGAYEDLEAAGVLDPVKVTRSALQNAVSIGALVLTTDAIVVDVEEEEKEGEEGGEEKPEA